MGENDDIAEILAILERIVRADVPEGLRTSASSARNAVDASEGRARLGTRNLGHTARISVAGGALSPLSVAIRLGEAVAPGIRSDMASILSLARRLVSPGEHPKGRKGTISTDVRAWTKVRSGDLLRNSDRVGCLAISRRAHTPGGEWTVSVDGISICAASSIEEAAVWADRIEAYVIDNMLADTRVA